MPMITKKKLKDYKILCYDREERGILTLDGLRFIYEANGYNPAAIGEYILEVPGTIHGEGEM